jgi:DNA-binding transcriptional MerR regulator
LTRRIFGREFGREEENHGVSSGMTIGDFSRATRLSAKTLRFYHQVGLLAPARVDPANGYRLYTTEQIADAQVIRHFRALDMPLEQIREVLTAPQVADRHELISARLARMEAQLAVTRTAVASLRSLLEPPTAPVKIHYQSLPATSSASWPPTPAPQ